MKFVSQILFWIVLIVVCVLVVVGIYHFFVNNKLAQKQCYELNHNKVKVISKYIGLYASMGSIEGIVVIPINNMNSDKLRAQLYAKTDSARKYFKLNSKGEQIKIYLKKVAYQLANSYSKAYYLYYKNQGSLGYAFTDTGVYYYCTEMLNGKTLVIYIEKDSSDWNINFN